MELHHIQSNKLILGKLYGCIVLSDKTVDLALGPALRGADGKVKGVEHGNGIHGIDGQHNHTFDDITPRRLSALHCSLTVISMQHVGEQMTARTYHLPGKHD